LTVAVAPAVLFDPDPSFTVKVTVLLRFVVVAAEYVTEASTAS
jgi:hypothetical protein